MHPVVLEGNCFTGSLGHLYRQRSRWGDRWDSHPLRRGSRPRASTTSASITVHLEGLAPPSLAHRASSLLLTYRWERELVPPEGIEPPSTTFVASRAILGSGADGQGTRIGDVRTGGLSPFRPLTRASIYERSATLTLSVARGSLHYVRYSYGNRRDTARFGAPGGSRTLHCRFEGPAASPLTDRSENFRARSIRPGRLGKARARGSDGSRTHSSLLNRQPLSR